MAKSSPWLFGLFVIMLSGCASYQPRPLVPHDVLRDLQGIRLEALAGSPTPVGEAGPPEFNLTDGVSSDEAVAVALLANRALRAFRRERGVAEGEVVAAGVLPNPFLEVTWLHIENLTRSLATSGFDVGLRWTPPRPGELAAKRARAEARLAEVRAQIADEEWKLAADVRRAHASVLAARERRGFAQAALTLQGRVRQFLRDKRDLGDASRLEANLIELEYFETVREREAILGEETRARQELNRLLGLPPSTQVAVQGADLAYRALRLHPGVLEAVMVDRRPDLRVAREAYEQAEQQLRLAHILRIPWLSFGPTWERDGSAEEGIVNKVGLGIGFEIPLANLNRGELMRLDAARERLREGFAATVHTARAEVADAVRALRAHERLVRLYEDEIRPVLDENARLTAAALELGDVNVLQFVTAQSRVLKSRREFIEARLDYWKAVFDLERALGARVAEVEGREE